MDADERRMSLKEALIDASEIAIAARGLGGVRAREIASQAGCALGAIYNVFDDLDELVLAVNARTLAALEEVLTKAEERKLDPHSRRDPAVESLMSMANAYLDFAAANTARWRAVFDHRLPDGRSLPDWYLASQARLFAYVEGPLRALRPHMRPADRALLARSLFSAVHGLATLGLEEKLGAIPLATLREQVSLVVAAMGNGLKE